MAKEIKKDLMAFSCFQDFNLDEDNKEKKETLHETIQDNNEFILNSYAEQSYFKDIMPNIQKASRSNNFYNRIVKKGFKHKSPFFKVLMKAIKLINADNNKNVYIPIKEKRFNIYQLPKIELLKKKKEKIDKITEMKLKNFKLNSEKLNKYKKLIKKQLSSSSAFNINSIKTPKIISPLDTLNLNNTNNSFNQKFNSSEKLSKNMDLRSSIKDFSTYYKSDINFKNLIRNNSFNLINSPIFNKNNFNYIYDKCNEEIENGNKVSRTVFRHNERISKKIEKKLKNKSEAKKFHKIIEDKGNKRSKYRKLEEKNLKEIKRKINEKISFFYAYKNRKEFQGILKNSENVQGYNLYLNEMNRINQKMELRRFFERKKIDKIQTLCDDEFQKKEYLKNKIDKYNKRHKEINKRNGFIPNDDFYIINKNNNKELLGTLLPKLLSSRNKCISEIFVGNILYKK